MICVIGNAVLRHEFDGEGGSVRIFGLIWSLGVSCVGRVLGHCCARVSVLSFKWKRRGFHQ